MVMAGHSLRDFYGTIVEWMLWLESLGNHDFVSKESKLQEEIGYQ